MATLAIQQRSYEAVSDKPMTRFEIYEPMLTTACAAGSIALAFINHSNYFSMAYAALAVAPAFFHGTKVYTDWIPKLLWKMPKGEILRSRTNQPDVKMGLAGWQSNSSHSHHFDQNLADALVGLCKKEKLSSHVDIDCAGKGEYSRVMRQAAIDSDGFDFSRESANSYCPKLTTLSPSTQKEYDLVTSFEAMSKTLPGQEETFVQKLVNATKAGGTIAMSCAIPEQSGPNSNPLANKEVIEIFEKYGCKYDASASCKLRRAANPMHIWFKNSIMVFKKGM